MEDTLLTDLLKGSGPGAVTLVGILVWLKPYMVRYLESEDRKNRLIARQNELTKSNLEFLKSQGFDVDIPELKEKDI